MIRSQARGITSVSADFVQKKNLKILKKPLISKGRVIFAAPDSLRWEYFAPVRSVLLVNNGSVKRYVLAGEKFVEDSSVNATAMQAVIENITMWMSGKFETPNFNVTFSGNQTITMIPKIPEMEKAVSKIELKLAEIPGMIEYVRVFESSDSFTELVFQKQEINNTLDPLLFEEIE